MENTDEVVTLAIDVGGSGVKTMLLDARGAPASDRQRADTPEPATPAAVLAVVMHLVKPLGDFDRVSVGFPGVVKHGVTYTAHNLSPKWIGFELEDVLTRKLGKPVRICNDAAVQGYGAIRGHGVELVLTLGTGLGSSLFTSGHLVPGLELAHHPWKKGKTYEEYLGKKALRADGRKRWNQNLEKALVQIASLFNYDHLFIGGGNAIKIDFPLPKHVSRVPNEDGLLGGVALWRDALAPTARGRASGVKLDSGIDRSAARSRRPRSGQSRQARP